ncbi:MAG: phosphoglucomutase [Clostridiales bacterium GWF2_38_85]|nr:MAG: phosphoglucomutase [Clostridiales bacterium GWF2_38_85]HBL84951.1 phosphoglucomutase [Clostridiales bacterium]
MNTVFEKWLNSDKIDDATRAELLAMKDKPHEIALGFNSPMQFGTAGLRSFMGAGISRMNKYTVAHTTQGLASLILSEEAADKGVVIAYDSRNNSELFAKTAACVLAANKIKVYLFESLRPTPELSFAVLYLKAIAGINITASHNPKEYNGYKVFWSDGAQLSVEHAETVSAAVEKSDIFYDVFYIDFNEAVNAGIINIIGKEIDEPFMQAVLDCRINPELIEKYADSLNIIYTPFHGAGGYLVPETLKRAGLNNLRIVPEQKEPDGNFPTVKSPNPENKEGFALAINMALNSECDCDLMIATDPDADRIGIIIKDSDGLYSALSGNQVGILLAEYIITARKEKGILPENACAVRSVVSSRLFDAICIENGVTSFIVLTGFKYIGEKINEVLESGSNTFIFGYEESCGYLPGPYIRDKDGIGASLLFVELAAYYRSKGKSVYEALQDIYNKYGYYDEYTLNNMIAGLNPMAEMNGRMENLRSKPRSEIFETSVLRIRDYNTGELLDLITGNITKESLPVSNMLVYELEDSTEIAIRPSGTEPKVKIYILAKGKSALDVKNKIEKYKKITI